MEFSSADHWEINELRIKRIHPLTTETFIKYNLCSVRAFPPHRAGAAETQLKLQLMLINFLADVDSHRPFLGQVMPLLFIIVITCQLLSSAQKRGVDPRTKAEPRVPEAWSRIHETRSHSKTQEGNKGKGNYFVVSRHTRG